MKIVQRQKRAWYFTCCECYTILELDETDFVMRMVKHGGNDYRHYYIGTPCPVCGKLWGNVDRNDIKAKLVPIEE